MLEEDEDGGESADYIDGLEEVFFSLFSIILRRCHFFLLFSIILRNYIVEEVHIKSIDFSLVYNCYARVGFTMTIVIHSLNNNGSFTWV